MNQMTKNNKKEKQKKFQFKLNNTVFHFHIEGYGLIFIVFVIGVIIGYALR